MSPAPLLDLEYVTCCFLLFSAFQTILAVVKTTSACPIQLLEKLVKSGDWSTWNLKSQLVLWKILMGGALTVCTVQEDLPKGMDIWELCPGCLFSGQSWRDTQQNLPHQFPFTNLSAYQLPDVSTSILHNTRYNAILMRLQSRHDHIDSLLRSYT